MRKLLTYFLIATLIFPWTAFAQSAINPTDPNNPAFAGLKAALPRTINVPSNPDVNGNFTSITPKPVDYLSYATSKQLAPGCNPVIWASMLAKAQAATVRDTMNAVGAHTGLTQGMNNQCLVKVGANGQDSTTVDAAVIAQKEAELHAIESAICSLNFNGLLSGVLGLNLSICKGGNLLGGGISDTLSKTFLAQAQDFTKVKDCLQAKDANQNLADSSSGTPALDALSGGIANFPGLSTGGTGGFTLGFGTNVNAGVNVNSNNGVTTSGGTTTTTGPNAPVASGSSTTPPPVSNPVGIPVAPANPVKPVNPFNIFK